MSGIDNLGYNVELQENGLCDNDGQRHGSFKVTIAVTSTKVETPPSPEHQIHGSTKWNSNSNIQQPPVHVNANGSCSVFVKYNPPVHPEDGKQVGHVVHEEVMQVNRDREPLTICKWMTNRPKTWFGKVCLLHIICFNHVCFS